MESLELVKPFPGPFNARARFSGPKPPLRPRCVDGPSHSPRRRAHHITPHSPSGRWLNTGGSGSSAVLRPGCRMIHAPAQPAVVSLSVSTADHYARARRAIDGISTAAQPRFAHHGNAPESIADQTETHPWAGTPTIGTSSEAQRPGQPGRLACFFETQSVRGFPLSSCPGRGIEREAAETRDDLAPPFGLTSM